MKLIDWIRPEFRTVKGYSACKTVESLMATGIKRVVKLDANENPWGSNPAAIEAVRKLETFSIYPDARQEKLRKIAADYCHVSPEEVCWGAGSSQLIDYALRLFVSPNDELINLVPTYPQYKFLSDVNCNTVVSVPRDENFNIDVEAIKNAITPKTKLIFIANPNNPTGNLTPIDVIEDVLKLGIPTVLDEAYYEFSGLTALPLRDKYPNLMVLRTMSKFAGLCGLRAGYGIFPAEIVERLDAIRDPYNINVAAVAAVEASMEHYDELMVNVKKVNDERDRMLVELAKFPFFKVFPSKANYILCRCLGDVKSSDVQQQLENKGILSRCYSSTYLKNDVRFSIGTPEEDDFFIDALKSLDL